MRLLLLRVGIWLAFGFMLVRGILFAESLSQPSILPARIVQLEEQVRQLQRTAQVCAAQLLIAQQPQQDKEAQEKLDKAAKEMGCEHGANWSVNPPACN